jgi:DNA end-binding protein Ku
MPRPIWKGHITFGLVNVPAGLYSAENRGDLHFNLVDSRNHARVRYERVNEVTGEEVPWSEVVKAYEYDGGSFVLLGEQDFKSAAAEMTKTIEIEHFVDEAEIDAIYFDRPYLLVPEKGGEKGYVILREAMRESGRVGIATVVIRTRQHLAAMLPEGDALVLNLLRFQQELRDWDEFSLPGDDLKKYKVSTKEIELAGQLIDGMTTEWEPENYRDEYRDALMKVIQDKIAAGKEHELAEPEDEEEDEEPRHVNFMELLKKSVEAEGKRSGGPKQRKAAGRAPRKKGKRAG